MKRFVLGFILGGILFGFLSVSAAEYIIKSNNYPIVVDGTQASVEALNINDFTYVKLRDVSKALGGLVDIKFNENKEQIEINKVTTSTTALTSDTKGVTTMSTTATTISTKPTSTPDGITDIWEYEGKYYIPFSYIQTKINPRGYDISKKLIEGKWQFKKGDLIILDNIPFQNIYGADSFEFDYYVNTILPLIK